MIFVGWPKSNTGTIIEPQTSTLRLFLWDLEPLLTPDTFNAFVVDLPAVSPQKCCNASIAVATILAGKPDNLFSEKRFLDLGFWLIPLSRTRLTDHMANSPFGHIQPLPDMVNALTPPGGA